MNKSQVQLTEVLLVLFISMATVVINPPLPLLAIPFILIMVTRSICMKLEDSIERQRFYKKYTLKDRLEGGKNE